MLSGISRQIDFSILSFSHCTDSNWNYRDVLSPFWRIYLVTGGDGILYHNNQTFELKTGWMYLVPEFTKKSNSSTTYLEHYYLHLIQNKSFEISLTDVFNFNYERKADDYDIYLFKRLLEINPNRQLKESNPMKYKSSDLYLPIEKEISPDEAVRKIESRGIILQLFSKFVSDTPKLARPEYRYTDKLVKVSHYIEKNLEQPIDVIKLADLCFLSPDYFSKIFLKHFGLRPLPYINKKRLEKAQLQLVLTNEPVEAVAQKVGFPNVSYFIKTFKENLGKTPKEYRKANQI